MFEKEAEEYADVKAKKLNISRDSTIIPYMQTAWQKGAEFGYNKAIEWHDLEKDPTDLPKENKEYIVQAECIMFPGHYSYHICRYEKEWKSFVGEGLGGLNAIKWKEFE